MLLEDFATDLDSETEQVDLSIEDFLLKHPALNYIRLKQIKDMAEIQALDLDEFLEANGILSPRKKLKLNLVLQGIVPEVEGLDLIDDSALEATLANRQLTDPLTYPEPGQNLGVYQLKSVLGEGASSRVYDAYHPLLNRHLAIKVFSPLLALRSAKAREDFIQEGVHCARFNHPALPQIYDAVSTDSYVYMVMEKIEGKTLQYVMERQAPMPLQHILVIVGQICQALEYIHDSGLVHCDVKPENIMILPTGKIKLLDLGVARSIQDGAQHDTVAGSPYYMAPEHFDNRPEIRSDIYSLGIVLYALCTGELPFLTENLQELIDMHKHKEAVRPCAVNQQVCGAIDKLIMSMLSKKPEDRPENCAVLLEHLGLILAREILPGSRTPVSAMREFLGV